MSSSQPSEPGIHSHLGLPETNQKGDGGYMLDDDPLPWEDYRTYRSSIETLRHNTIGGSARKSSTPQRPVGRRQEIQQDFRHLSTIGFTSLVMGLFWSTIWCHIGQLFVTLSLAEMSSMVPAAGGQYQWITEFAPRHYKMFLSYCSGWLCSIGWQARFASICYMVAGILQTLISHNGDEDYPYSRSQRGLITIGVAFCVSAFNTFAAGHLSIAEGLFTICHVFALVPIIASMWVLSDRNSISEALKVFHDHGSLLDNRSTWSSTALSVLVGQPSSFLIVLGTDAVTHIAEEIEEPDLVVPQCMFWSFLANMPLTIITLFTFVFNCGELDKLFGNARPPFVHVFQAAFAPELQPANAFTGVIICLMFMVAVSTMVATSRHLYSFGRDRAVSYSAWITRVHPCLKVPLNAILCTILMTAVICAVCINNTSAQRTMMCMSTACIHVTYIASLVCLILKRVRGEQLPSARWSLGRAGLPVNILAIVYCSWAVFWSFWPGQSESTWTNYNSTPMLFVVVLVIAVGMFMAAKWRVAKRAATMR